MKERPIIMSGDNPKLILEGRKTQTRRLIKPQPQIHGKPFDAIAASIEHIKPKCPYGVAGDRLWVREKFAYNYESRKGNRRVRDITYATAGNVKPTDGWRPSIHMPRWASRITLEITKVRVERLQDISDQDCEAEGCYAGEIGRFDFVPNVAFAMLWDSLHGKGAWDKNPWVFVIEFCLSPDVQSTNVHGEKTRNCVGAAQQEKG